MLNRRTGDGKFLQRGSRTRKWGLSARGAQVAGAPCRSPVWRGGLLALLCLGSLACTPRAETPPPPEPSPFPPSPLVEVVVFNGPSCDLLPEGTVAIHRAVPPAEGDTTWSAGERLYLGDLPARLPVASRGGRVLMGTDDYAPPLLLRYVSASETTGDLAADAPASPAGEFFGVDTPRGQRRYRGELRILASGDRVKILNRLGLEEYVAGVLGSEMPLSYPEAALRAQAVAARSYALYRLLWARDHGGVRPLAAGPTFQVYGGVLQGDVRAVRAVMATAGEILIHQDAIFCAYFHSTCGGETANAAMVFGDADIAPLAGVPCGACNDSRFASWESRWSLDELRVALTAWADEKGMSLAQLQSVAVSELTVSGRVRSVDVITPEAQWTIATPEFARLLRRDGRRVLRSHRFTITEKDGGFLIRGRGFGHRVGLCQVGAGVRGAQQSYREILASYYPGSDIAQLSSYYP